MRKQDLYDFIETKTEKAINLLNRELIELLESVREAAKKEFKGLGSITRFLKNADEGMDKLKVEHSAILHDYYVTNNAITSCNKAIYFESNVISRLSDIGKFNLEEDRDNNRELLAEKYPNFLIFLDSIREEHNAIAKNIKDLEKIKSELFAVIKGSRSGKDAYKSLVALNVNMSGFEDTKDKLPAVQELSVDVCVLNGDCK